MAENVRVISMDTAQERLRKSRFVFCELTLVLQTESRKQCFFPSHDNFEREINVDSGASLLLMSTSDLNPEEQETV